MNKTAVAIVGILCGLLVVGGFLGVLSTQLGWDEETTTEITVPAPTDVEEHVEVEDYTIEWEEHTEDKPVVEIYNEVELGMSEDEVWKIAGSPDITSQMDDEYFGVVLELIYSDSHSLDNVTVMFDDGVVTMIVLGEFDGENISVKSKM